MNLSFLILQTYEVLPGTAHASIPTNPLRQRSVKKTPTSLPHELAWAATFQVEAGLWVES